MRGTMKKMGGLAAAVTVLLTMVGAEDCDVIRQRLNQSAELPPDVAVSELGLRHTPSIEQLGAYYCPEISDDFFVQAGCIAALGPAPPKASLVFEFGLTITIHNPNDIPVPALDILLALTLFDDVNAEALGAICVSLCGTDDLNCDGGARPGACEPRAGDIRSIEDFVNALPGLIHDLATGQAEEELRKSTIAAGGDVSIDLDFVLGIDQALGVIEKVAGQFIDDYVDSGDATLRIPVSVEGTVYFQLPILGRIGVDYGPFPSSWTVF